MPIGFFYSTFIISYYIYKVKSDRLPLTFGKYGGHIEKSLEVAKNCHMGLDWEIGLLPPAAAGHQLPIMGNLDLDGKSYKLAKKSVKLVYFGNSVRPEGARTAKL